MPESLRIGQSEAQVLVFVYQNPGLDLEEWPDHVRRLRAVEKLRKERRITRKYFPTRYYLSRSGYPVASWIVRLNGLQQHKYAI